MFASCALSVFVLIGQVAAEKPTEAERLAQLKYLKEKAAERTLHGGPGETGAFPLKAEPILRYDNVLRGKLGTRDGATFLWLDGTLPVAATSISIRGPNDLAYQECTAFSSGPLECRLAGAAVWSPKGGGLVAQRLDGPAPASSKVQRLTQMRALAARFAVTGYDWNMNEPRELRLLTQPLYRFESEKHNIIDGTLYAFVVTNDPEMFVLIEATTEHDPDAQWQFTLARMSSLPQKVRLDDKEIWSLTNYQRDTAEKGKLDLISRAR
jgi:hypothetical protein